MFAAGCVVAASARFISPPESIAGLVDPCLSLARQIRPSDLSPCGDPRPRGLLARDKTRHQGCFKAQSRHHCQSRRNFSKLISNARFRAKRATRWIMARPPRQRHALEFHYRCCMTDIALGQDFLRVLVWVVLPIGSINLFASNSTC